MNQTHHLLGQQKTKDFNMRNVMGPPRQPAQSRSRKSSTSCSSTPWGRGQDSVVNNSTLQTTNTSTSFVEGESKVIVALTEGRGDSRGEVGLASIDLQYPHLTLCQISESHNYINTLTKINQMDPSEIIVPATFLESTNNRLINQVRNQFPAVKLTPAPRNTFNKSNGMDRISQLCIPSKRTIYVGLQHRYYALAAASALLTFIQNKIYVFYARNSLNVSYEESDGYAIIDIGTADKLELVASTKPNQASRYSSLFAILNGCYTWIGARMLRSTILQPPFALNIIKERQNCVTELIKLPEKLVLIQEILQKIPQINQILNLTSIIPVNSQNCSHKQLNYVLLLNSLLDVISPLKDALDGFKEPFFQDFKGMCDCEDFTTIKDTLGNMIHPAARFARGEQGINQRCFAIKPGINGMLDLMRKAYSERLEEMIEYVSRLGTEYGLTLTLANNNTKGYHIVYKLNAHQKATVTKSDLPDIFMQVCRLTGSFTMKTPELVNLSDRINVLLAEILQASNVMIHKTLLELKNHIGFFYDICDNVARLDMLQSLAQATLTHGYVRPKFNKFTEVRQASHPLLKTICRGDVVANEILITQDHNIHIITGPNGSGKSIYIRQIILLQVLAQIGCYVPAEFATFRPADRIFARISMEDNLERGVSAFIFEMKEINYMMTTLSDNSLFIIDELCRFTSVEEGAAIAWTVCEKLCASSAFVYITTHFPLLTKLYDLYLNVKVWQMETVVSEDTPRGMALNFKYKIIPGVTIIGHYGICMAGKVWPSSSMDNVYEMLNTMAPMREDHHVNKVDERLRLKYDTESELRKLKAQKKLTTAKIEESKLKYWRELQTYYDNDVEITLTQIEQEEDSVNDRTNLNENSTEVQRLFMDEDADENEDGRLQDDQGVVEMADLTEGCADMVQSETSSYRNLSTFLREDDDNVNKLIPEIAITCASQSCDIDDNENLSRSYDQERAELSPTGSSSSIVLLKKPEESTSNSCEGPSVSPSPCSPVLNQSVVRSHTTPSGSAKTQFIKNLNFSTSIQNSDQYVAPQTNFLNLNQESSSSRTTSNAKSIDGFKQFHWVPVPPHPGDSLQQDSSNMITNEMTCFGYETSTTDPRFLRNNSSNSDQNRDQETTAAEVPRTASVADSSANPHYNSTVIVCQSNFAMSDETLDSNQFTGQPESRRGRGNVSFKFPPRDLPKTPSLGTLKRGRFVPPKKLTKRQIQEDFQRQDRRYFGADMSTEDYERHFKTIVNRPSVNQIRSTRHLGFYRRMRPGEQMQFIPAEPEQKMPFVRPSTSTGNFNLEIFSDRNSKSFEKFLNSSNKDLSAYDFSQDLRGQGDVSRLDSSVCRYGSRERPMFEDRTLDDNALEMDS